MKLNAVEKAAMNNPIREWHQRRREAEWFRSLAGGSLTGSHVLEIGCGRGVGTEVLLDHLHATRVTAIDLDENMVEQARKRLRQRQETAAVAVGDALSIPAGNQTFDAVADFGILHHVPDWRQAVADIARVLRPGGLLLFEEVPRGVLDTWLFRTVTDHPRQDRFEAAEFVEELSRHGLHGQRQVRHRLGGLVFVGAARLVA
jgi:ubiquinone/menaquinone biosynthesis C-methylase UbiE